MKYSGHWKLLCELSNYQNLMLLTFSDIKRTLMHLFLFTNSAQRELVSILKFYGFFGELNFSWRNISPEIPEKFSGLGHQFYGFFWEFNKRHNLEKFSRLGLFTLLPILRFFGGNGIKDLVARNSWEFLWNFSQEIPINYALP